MGHSVVPEVSKKNPYHIPKYRFLELKYFCLQYPSWKREVEEINYVLAGRGIGIKTQVEFQDQTFVLAERLAKLNSKITLVGKIAKKSDSEIGDWVLKGVTEGVSFVRLKTVYDIPCERDMYYDRYRKFFFLLSESRS